MFNTGSSTWGGGSKLKKIYPPPCDIKMCNVFEQSLRNITNRSRKPKILKIQIHRNPKPLLIRARNTIFPPTIQKIPVLRTVKKARLIRPRIRRNVTVAPFPANRRVRKTRIIKCTWKLLNQISLWLWAPLQAILHTRRKVVSFSTSQTNGIIFKNNISFRA